MHLFPSSVLEDVRRIPGASHAFLRHVVAPDGEPIRDYLHAEVADAPPEVAGRWRELLHSLDNRRFVQGLSEVSTHAVLRASGWSVSRVDPSGPTLVYQSPGGTVVDVAVLGFAPMLRPLADRAIISGLVQSLDRLPSRSRIAVVVRRWLPHDFDPEPVRRAIDMWLQEVDRGGWEGRYAAYDDKSISLEFALTGRQADPGEGIVAFTLGPLDALHTLEAVQAAVTEELNRWRHSPSGGLRPLLTACVSTQPWRLPRGYLREALLGKPIQMTTGPEGFQLHFGVEQSPSLLRDPLHRELQGVLFIGHDESGAGPHAARAYLNPWSRFPLLPDHLQIPCLAACRYPQAGPVMRWVQPGG